MGNKSKSSMKAIPNFNTHKFNSHTILISAVSKKWLL